MYKFIVAPVLGGVIGYITNDLAIRMLFRPRKAIYIGKFHVPFTPGLIPSQKERIARSVGKVISEQLLNEETMKETLLSEKTIASLQEKVREAVRGLFEDDRTIKELLEARFDPETIRTNTRVFEDKATELICEKIDEAKLGHSIVDSLMGNIMDMIAQNKVLSKFMDASAQKTIRDKFADKINELISEKAPETVRSTIHKYRARIINMRICDIYEKYHDKEDWLIERGTELYIDILGNNMEKVLRALNLEQIIVNKISGFDAVQLEEMIFGIMKRELKAIVYLGAGLGFLMGFINLLF